MSVVAFIVQITWKFLSLLYMSFCITCELVFVKWSCLFVNCGMGRWSHLKTQSRQCRLLLPAVIDNRWFICFLVIKKLIIWVARVISVLPCLWVAVTYEVPLPIGSSWTPPRPRSCVLPAVVVFTCCPSRLQVSQGCTAVVTCRRPLPDGRRRGSTSSTFGLVTISGCAPYAAVDVRRPSFPGCHFSSLEQSATPRHVCTVTACFPHLSVDPSLQTQFSLTVRSYSRSDTRHYGHINRCFYLLTDWLIEWAIDWLNDLSSYWFTYCLFD